MYACMNNHVHRAILLYRNEKREKNIKIEETRAEACARTVYIYILSPNCTPGLL